MKGCLQWQQMLCVQWPHGDSLECAQHFTRHRPTYWPKHIDQMPRRTKGAREHPDLWDCLFTEQGIYGHWENLQITVVFVHIVLMICQREREGSDQPIEADMELMWGQYGSITSNRGGVANIGDHPPPSNAISLCVYSVRSPALPSARTQCRAENIRTRVKSLQMSSILSPITQTWASSLQGTQPNQDIKRKNHFLIKAIMNWKIKMKNCVIVVWATIGGARAVIFLLSTFLSISAPLLLAPLHKFSVFSSYFLLSCIMRWYFVFFTMPGLEIAWGLFFYISWSLHWLSSWQLTPPKKQEIILRWAGR